MSKKTSQEFKQTYGNLIPIRNSQCLFNDKNIKNIIIYELVIDKSQQPQLNASIEQEIQLQNELAGKIKQYLKIIEYAIEETEQNKIVQMVVEMTEKNNSILNSFDEINDQASKVIYFKKILQQMMDLEQRNPKILYFRQKNIFYCGNLIYLTIFGWTQEFEIPNARNQTLNKLADLTFQISQITYLDENGEEKQHKLTKHKQDLGLLFQQSILKKNQEKISIQNLNTISDDQELKKLAKIIKGFIINNSSIQEMNLQLQQSNQSQQIREKLIEEWEKFIKLQQVMDQEQLKAGFDLQILRELSADQLAKYIEIQQKEYQSSDNKKKKRAKILIFQAEQRLQALNLINKQNKDPQPNLIYFLNENELKQLKEDKKTLQQIQVDETKINKYIELLQKMSLCLLEQMVLDNEQLRLIPLKMLQSINNSIIQKFCSDKEYEISKSASKIERFDFEKPLEAKDKSNKFQLAINKSSINVDILLENKLTFQEIELLNEKTQNTYRDSIVKTIESKRNSTDQKDQYLLNMLTDTLNQSFQGLQYKQPTNINSFKLQLYTINSENSEGLYLRGLVFNDNNKFNFSEKVNRFFQKSFSGDIVYDAKFRLFLRKFKKGSISNYDGEQINGKQYGLGLRKINENHLKFGIFSFDQQKWGWEILLQSKIISFYKGPFLNDQKDGQGIQQISDFSKIDPDLIEEYVGQFKKDKRHGNGELTFFQINKETNKPTVIKVIKGDFKDDQVNGFANIQENNNIIFSGYFKNGKKNGYGEEIQEQIKIAGCYWDEKKTGTHITRYPDGRTTSKDYGSRACCVF